MIQTIIKEIPLSFHTDKTVFSPNNIDLGTLAMLSVVDFQPSDRILDLGCGYGVVGILASKIIGPSNVTMCDISEDALALARTNATTNGVDAALTIQKSDGLREITSSDFTMILSNPPYHTDFSVAKHFIEEGYKKLTPNGYLYMVTKRRDWYKNKIIAVFGGVVIKEIDGYFVFIAQKRPKKKLVPKKNEQTLSKKLKRKVEKQSNCHFL